MKAILFKKFDEQGYYRGSNQSSRKYTVRGAMAHLESMGFAPINDRRKLPKCWSNGAYNAYII